MPVALSGGEQQRLCIARAIVNRPRCSSPTSPPATSTPTTRARSSTSSRSFNQVGVTVLLSTHDEASLARPRRRRIALAGGALADARRACAWMRCARHATRSARLARIAAPAVRRRCSSILVLGDRDRAAGARRGGAAQRALAAASARHRAARERLPRARRHRRGRAARRAGAARASATRPRVRFVPRDAGARGAQGHRRTWPRSWRASTAIPCRTPSRCACARTTPTAWPALRAEWPALPEGRPGPGRLRVVASGWRAGSLRRPRAGRRRWPLLGAAVAFIVGHLIRLQVLTRREEIEVSQLRRRHRGGRAPALPLPRDRCRGCRGPGGAGDRGGCAGGLGWILRRAASARPTYAV